MGVISVPDQRWDRCDIKSIGLLPNVLAKQSAREHGAFEAWFVGDDEEVREGASTNAWIVSKEGILRTRPVDHHILSGVTRAAIIELVARSSIPFEERGFTLREAKSADEAFISSATNFVLPVTSIDGLPIGDGKPGKTSRQLRALYLENLTSP